MESENLSRFPKWIILFGSPSLPDGSLSRIQLRRCELAKDRFSANPDSVILVLGGSAHNDVIESDTMKQWLIFSDVPSKTIWTENKTTTTFEQAALISKLSQRHDPKQIFVISDWTHMLRVRMLLRSNGLKMQKVKTYGAKMDKGLSEPIRLLIYEAFYLLKDGARIIYENPGRG